MKRWVLSTAICMIGLAAIAGGVANGRCKLVLHGLAFIVAAGAFFRYGDEASNTSSPPPILVLLMIAVFGLLTTALYL